MPEYGDGKLARRGAMPRRLRLPAPSPGGPGEGEGTGRTGTTLTCLQLQGTGPDQVRQVIPLLLVEQRVDLAQRLGHGVAQALGAVDPQVGAVLCLGFVEGLAPDGVGERRHRAAAVDLGLGALGLELVQDAGQLADLSLVELELVGEEAQRASDAERAAPEVVTVAAMTARVARVGTVAPTAALSLAATRTAARACPTWTTIARLAGLPPLDQCRMHVFLLSPGPSASRRVLLRVGNMPHACMKRNRGLTSVKSERVEGRERHITRTDLYAIAAIYTRWNRPGPVPSGGRLGRTIQGHRATRAVAAPT